MAAYEDLLVADWTIPLYTLKQAWAACTTDVNALTSTCRTQHSKAPIDCAECHRQILARIHAVFASARAPDSPLAGAWFAKRSKFLAELDVLFEKAGKYEIDCKAISDCIAREKVQWYREMVTQLPLLIAALENTHGADDVARLLGTDPEAEASGPVEYDFEELSDAVASAIGQPKGRTIGPKEVEEYSSSRRAREDDVAKKIALDFLFARKLAGSMCPGVPAAILDKASEGSYLPGTEKYASMYMDSSMSLERLIILMEADLKRTTATPSVTHPHQQLDRRRALGLGTATPLTPAQRQRVDDLIRIINSHSKRTNEMKEFAQRIDELTRAKRANDEEAERKKREKASLEDKRRAEAVRQTAARAAAAAEAKKAAAGKDSLGENAIPRKMYEVVPCSGPNCKETITPSSKQQMLGCGICVVGMFNGRIDKQTLYCSEACYNAGHDVHTAAQHPCESGASCIRLITSTPISATATTTRSGATATPLMTTTTMTTNNSASSATPTVGIADTTTAVACLMCDVRLKRNSFFCCLACAKQNKDAHIAGFHAEAFSGEKARGMPKTIGLGDFLAKRLSGYVKGGEMMFPVKEGQ